VPAAWKRHYEDFAVKTAAKRAITAWGTATQRLRRLPDFIIIGAQRAGTTSLYEYLAAHPAVVGAAPSKGVHYFDTDYARRLGWYRGHFPSTVRERYVRVRHGQMVTGEASPYYLFHPEVPARVAAVLPDVKLIALLREPVDRAYSQYSNELARGFEQLAFEDALDAEAQRLAGEEQRLRSDARYVSFSHQHHSYVARGLYLEQLRRWQTFFPDGQMLVLDSSRLFADPAATLSRVQEFLGLERRELPAYPAENARSRDPLGPETRQRLSTLFEEPNRRLFAHLGVDFGWNRERAASSEASSRPQTPG
jgi:sulfotransferase family protein